MLITSPVVEARLISVSPWLTTLHCYALYPYDLRSYIRSWERLGDLPWMIEILCLFENGAQQNEPEDTQTSITIERLPELSQ